MSDNMRLSLILSAKDRLSSVVRTSVLKSEKAFERFERKLEKTSKTFNDIGKRSLVAGSAMIASGGLMLKSAADFESSMSSVSTLIDTNTESLSAMNKQVLQIGKRTPVALNDLTGALYDIRSAGISASDQFRVLEKSAQLGIAGLGSTKEAVDLVTSSINAFKLAGSEQDKLYDNIFKTIKTGKTTISQLAQGFGATAGTVAAAGIKIDDYLASVAALTTTGQPAAQAHTQMKAAIAGLTRNTKEQQLIFRSLHAKDFNDLIQKSGSVVGAFSGINKAVKGNKAQLISILGSIEAYNAVLSLTGNQNKAYVDTIEAMRYGSDAFSEAYQKKLVTLNAQLQRGSNLIMKIGIDLGTYLIPPFMKVLNVADKVLTKLDLLPESTKKFIAVGTVATGMGLITFGGLNLAIGSTINAFKGFLRTYRDAAAFMRRHRFTAKIKAIRALGAAVRGFGLSIAATPVGWIVAGVAAIAVAGLLIYKYWKPIKAFFGGLVAGIKSGLAPTFQQLKRDLAPFQPILTKVGQGISAFGNFIRKIITPVNSAGTASRACGENLGLLIGKFIGAGVGVGRFLIKTNPLIMAAVTIYKNFDKIGGAVNKAKTALHGFFANVGKGKSIQVAANITGKPVDGSHANGLSFVPRDGYIAELHRGERVLTAGENRQLVRGNFGQIQSIQYVFSPVINAEGIRDIKEIEAMIDRKQKEFFAKLKTETRRKEVREYAA